MEANEKNNNVPFIKADENASAETKVENVPNNQVPMNQPIILPNHPRRKKNKFLSCFVPTIIILLILALAATLFWATGGLKTVICKISADGSFLSKSFECGVNTNTTSSNFSQGKTVDIDTSKLTTQEQLVLAIVKQTKDSVVTIAASSQLSDSSTSDQNSNSMMGNESQNIGSGFIVRDDGLILTNAHVVDDTSLDYFVLLNGEKDPVKVDKIYRDSTDDIALVKINKTGLTALKLGDSDKLQIGNFVVAIGSPLGDLTGTVTTGIISGLNRDVTAGSSSTGSTKSFQGVLQTDAPINPGNSGGPLINSAGEVVGINFATSTNADNISFSLPINRVKIKLSEFQDKGRLVQPYIGIAYTQKTYYQEQGTYTGALISQVQSGSPAEKGGLKKGDIITKVNGNTLDNSSLQDIIQRSRIDDTLTLEVKRGNDTLTLKVQVGDRSQS